ncbi:EamA family transporter [Comamonas serinivorans]|uniref:EamA family transporter n=1 Tax=Comamonas serinivorans TaxID=1082851 RepID=A0A1Y0ELQ2_9BURK|nr:DMT family transporter [Comamonas serinivorans]ARU04585.1 EamA family transporter [Comamonas serinivorans]
MSSSSRQVLIATAAVLGSVAALGLGTSFAKQLFPLIGAQGTSGLRVGFSALVLTLIFRPWRWRLTRSDWRAVMQYGLALGLMNLLFYMAIRTIPFGLAVAIEFTGPLAVALMGMRRRLDAVWIALAVVGLCLLLPWQGADQALDPSGVAYALGAAVFWAAYIVYGKRAGTLPGGAVVAWGMCFAALVVVPVGVWHAGPLLLDPGLLVFALGVAIVSSAIPISLEMFALQRLPKETFGVLTSTEPAMAAMLGWVLLHERLTAFQWLAIACVMAASIGCAITASTGMRQRVEAP